MLRILREENIDNSQLGLRLAKEYKKQLDQPLRHFSETDFERWRDASIAEQEAREQDDTGTCFDDYLATYFENARCTAAECTKS